jgi:hypothetical protein
LSRWSGAAGHDAVAKEEVSFISWEVVAWSRTGAATPAPGHDAI